MASPTTEPEASGPQVVFRAGKKRKAYRQRAEIPDDAGEVQASPAVLHLAPAAAPAKPERQTSDDDDDDTEAAVAEALRLRNARKSRLKGVGFTAETATARDSGDDVEGERSLVVRQDDAGGNTAAAGGMTVRFAPQTGLTGELVNRHMEEYVESKLAKRHTSKLAVQERSKPAVATATKIPTATTAPKPPTGKPPDGAVSEAAISAVHGRLMEIDLGEEARNRNVALTERARRRLEGAPLESDSEADGGSAAAGPGGASAPASALGKGGKVRLGRDGKPWRSRNRRTSDDLRRDQLVEAVMRENRLDVYDPEPDGPPGALAGAAADLGAAGLGAEAGAGVGAGEEEDYEGAADDRIAEEFRREFMDALSQRRRLRRKPATTAVGGAGAGGPRKAGDGEVLKGPKLGGSRNTRAQMRDLLLKKEKEAAGRR